MGLRASSVPRRSGPWLAVRAPTRCVHQAWSVRQASPCVPPLTQQPGAVSFPFLKLTNPKPSFSKRQNSRNAAGAGTRLHLFYAAPPVFVSRRVVGTGGAEGRATAGNIWRRGCCGCWQLGGWYLGGGTGLSCRECHSSVLIKGGAHSFAVILSC